MPDARIDLPQGTLDLLILKTIALGPQHGWAISERIQQISSDVLRALQTVRCAYAPHVTWNTQCTESSP